MSKKSKNKNSKANWIILITILSFCISFVFSFASNMILDDVGIVLGILVLIIFVLIGIVFDMIGVAVTSADEIPINAMNSRKMKGASTALMMIHNRDKVSSICNDVVGDICGIISGTAAATISLLIATKLNVGVLFPTLIVTGITASLTIGGKALCKGIAINNSTSILYASAKVVSVFYKGKN